MRSSELSREVLPTSVKALITLIEREKPQNSQHLERLYKQVEISAEDLLHFNEFDHSEESSYGRCSVWNNDQIRICALSWNPGDFTAIHAHDNVDYGLIAFYGTSQHRIYDLHNNVIKLKKTEVITEGSIVKMDSHDFYHSMGNANEAPFMTLHIYGCFIAAETQPSRVFHIERNQVAHTYGGAYLNSPIESNEKMSLNSDPSVKKDYVTYVEDYFTRVGQSSLLKNLC